MLFLKKRGFSGLLFFVLLCNFVFAMPERLSIFGGLLCNFSDAFNQNFVGSDLLSRNEGGLQDFEVDIRKSFELTMHNLKEIVGEISEDNLYFIQKVVVPSDSRVLVVGDIHADLNTVRSLLNLWIKNDVFASPSQDIIFQDGFGFYELLQTSLKFKENVTVIFLGDYFDRGGKDLEVFSIMMKLKIDNPNNCFFIKGNHELDSYCEDSFINSMRLFFPLAQAHVEKEFLPRLFEFITKNIFQFFPSAILLSVEENERKILLTHGTIPLTDNFLYNQTFNNSFRDFNESDRRFMSIREKTARYFAWNDSFDIYPDTELIMPSPRDDFQSSMFKLSEDKVFSFLFCNNLHGIISGHDHLVPAAQQYFKFGLSVDRFSGLLNRMLNRGELKSLNIPGVYFNRLSGKFIIKHIAGPLYDGELGYIPSYLEFNGCLSEPFIVSAGGYSSLFDVLVDREESPNTNFSDREESSSDEERLDNEWFEEWFERI